jgi:hypothetical protein
MNLAGHSAMLVAEQGFGPPHPGDWIDPVDPRVPLILVARPRMDREA